ncbi:hypothetical protein F7Q92_17395 [Ideonella dechloratans]|uniref:Uncharacterized protein n=1 Tax=Ideonella dechloratans TaxID=36863 RepID=A0A643F835_IDEDE|nr:hypothetical protein [Ideonella dechloratans]KAB0576773.1 hypothetical protein F7Q92_17395 [Ideonella dechloratans]UFU09903.1 hypothetical protein LRM40_16645 [Ideonella dechloratans]
MPLTEDERQRLRDEELYRAQLRREMEPPRAPPGALERLSAFFESKVGFWLLTTVVAGLAVRLSAEFGNWINHSELEQRAKAEQIRAAAEQSRQELDTVMKIMPLLVSDQPAQGRLGVVLLNSVAAASGVQKGTVDQITAALQSVVALGAAPDASPQARAQADQVARLLDAGSGTAAVAAGNGASGASGAVTAAAAPARVAAPALQAVTLPARVYVQIGSEERRPLAQQALAALQQAGVLTPGIERVPTRSVPARHQLRYCPDKVSQDTLQQVQQALAPLLNPLDMTPLKPSQCGNVRPNHLELWLAD